MVDKNIITPLYTQVADELRREIMSKQYGESGCIGTHTQLAERFSVSLRTIRMAAQILEREGLVDIRQGKGTYVRSGMFVDQLKDLTGISAMLSGLDMDTEVRVPIFRRQASPEWLEPDVRAALGRECLFIRRLVLLEGVPAACAEMYLPGQYAASFSKEEVEQNTVYSIYQKKLGVELGRGRQIIQAAGASGELAASMRLPENAPILQLRRKAYDVHKNLIEYMILSYEASKYCFEVELDLYKQM